VTTNQNAVLSQRSRSALQTVRVQASASALRLVRFAPKSY
jgi:hypothetical protein